MKEVLKFFGYVLFGLFIIGLVVWLLMGGPQSLEQRKRFKNLVKSADHASIALAGIDLMNRATGTTVYSDTSCDALKVSYLPPVIARMRPKYVHVAGDRLHIEFHGGFDHYGFDIHKNDVDWEMTWYTEHGSHHLVSMPIRKDGEQSLPPVSGTRGTPAAYAPGAPGIPER